jgi:hypothetical protein
VPVHVRVTDQRKRRKTVNIEDMWILCNAENKAYLCPKGAGPDDGSDWQDWCMLWFRCREAAEMYYDTPAHHTDNKIILIPRRMGNRWRKSLQTLLNNSANWIVGIGYQNGQVIRAPYYSIQDLLEARFPKGLTANLNEKMPDTQDQKHRAIRRIESTEWASCGDVLIEASLVPRFAKDHGLGEDQVATKLMLLAKANVERLRQADEMLFGQSEIILSDGSALHTLIFDGKVFISELPFFSYETPPVIQGILLIKGLTSRPSQAHDGQNRTDGRISE